MSQRNVTIETLTSIEKALADECGALCMDDAKDRAHMAWWINQNFVEGDFAQRVARREVKKGPAPLKGSESK